MKQIVYSGTEVGIPWTVKATKREGTKRTAWASYIYLHESTVPEDLRPSVFLKYELRKFTDASPLRLMFNYYGDLNPLILDLPWHGGVTYYDCSYPDTPGVRVAQIGCDYSHLGDEHTLWNVDIVTLEIEHVCRSLRKAFPSLTFGCRGCGKQCQWSELEESPRRFCLDCRNKI